MTEQEFDQQVWRRFDVVTTDTGIETTVMNVCFSTRSVRIYVKNAPAEWLPSKRIVVAVQTYCGAYDAQGRHSR